jgi:hypothetical protein
MLDVDPLLLEAIRGSAQPTWRARAWYDGRLSYPDDLPVESWKVTVDGTQMVERSASMTIASDDEALDPVAVTSPLAVWGQEVDLSAGVSMPDRDILCPLGRFVIYASDPEDSRRVYRYATSKGAYSVPLFHGVRIDLDQRDRGLKLDEWEFTGPEQSRAGRYLYQEVARLVNPVAVTGPHQVADRMLTSTITYDTTNRLTALDQLARYAGARVIVDTAGLVTLVPRASTGDTWVIPSGDEGVIVRLSRKMSRDGFANGVWSTGRNSQSQEQYVGWAREGFEYGDRTSPLRWGGPAGQATRFHDSPLIDSYGEAFADALTSMRTVARERMQTIEIDCPLNPALEPFDTVSFEVTGKGTFSGTVQKWTGDSSGSMTITALVPLDAWMELR